VASLRPIRTAHKTLGGHILEHPSCGGFMPTAETTLIPASSINQRASKKSLTGNARLDNETNLRLRHSIEFIDENGGGPGGDYGSAQRKSVRTDPVARTCRPAFLNRSPAYADAREPLMAWYSQVKAADWATPAHVKRDIRSASVLKDGRVVFNLAGNKYRIVVWITILIGSFTSDSSERPDSTT
jgi:mRNA interferase HigB